MKKSIVYYTSIIKNNKGLTLVEVLVAIVILAIGLLGVAMMQYMSVAGNAFGREMQIATELGQERLEIVKSMRYADVVTIGNGYESLSDSANLSRFGGNTFTRRWWIQTNCSDINVSPNPNNPCAPATTASCTTALNNALAIATRVCWVDKNGGNHSVTLTGVKWNETAAP